MPAGVLLSDGTRPVNDDFDMQPMVLQQHGGWVTGAAAIAHELVRPRERSLRVILQRDRKAAGIDLIACRIAMGADGERRRLIQNLSGLRDDAGATVRVIARTTRRTAIFRDDVSPVERIVQTAPARIRSIQRIPRVRYRNDELWAGNGGDLGIDVFGGDQEISGFRLQIAYAAQEVRIVSEVDRPAAALQVPRIDLALQLIALLEQGLVARRQIADQSTKAFPECGGLHAGPRDRFVVDKVVQRPCNLHAAGGLEIHFQATPRGFDTKSSAAGAVCLLVVTPVGLPQA